jgi:hypothetical protein
MLEPAPRRLSVALLGGTVVGAVGFLVLRAGLDVAGQVSDIVGGGLTTVTFILAYVLPPRMGRHAAATSPSGVSVSPSGKVVRSGKHDRQQSEATIGGTGAAVAVGGGEAFSGVSGVEPRGSLRVDSTGAAIAVGEGSRACSGIEFRTPRAVEAVERDPLSETRNQRQSAR